MIQLVNSFTAHDKNLVNQYNAQEKENEFNNIIKNEVAKLGLGNITVRSIAFDKNMRSHKNNLLLLADYFAGYKGLAVKKHQIHRWLKVIMYASKVRMSDILAFQNVDMLEISLRLMGVFLPENPSSYVQNQPMGKKTKVIIA